ncbi:nonsense-mediated mRNA decay factor SMG9-like [Ciona intestinalis]
MNDSGNSGSQPYFINRASAAGKKKRFRDHESRSMEYQHESPTNSYGANRPDTLRTSKDSGDDQDKSNFPLSQPSTKPVILAKPSGKSSQGSNLTPDGEKTSPWQEVSASPSGPIAPKLSMSFTKSPSVGDKKNLFRTSSDSKFRNTASSYLVKQGLAQAAASSSNVQNLNENSATKSKDPGFSKRSIKLLDSSLHWLDGGIELLQDQPDFLVVGVIGMQGVGKSTVMSLIGGNKLSDLEKHYLFKQQTSDIKERAEHMTTGIDVAVTAERLILLDTQPILSPSLIEQSVPFDRKSPTDYNGSVNIEVQSLQVTAFLLTVCHVVIVVQDWFTDSNVYRFLQTAEMLKPVTPPPTHDSGGASDCDPSELQPVVLFVHNKLENHLFSIRSIAAMNEVMYNLTKFSSLHCRGTLSLIETNLYAGLSSLVHGESEVNSFLLPDVNHTDEEDEKYDVTKLSHDPSDRQFLSLPTYVGRPNTVMLTETLRKMILTMPRHQLTHHSLTEKQWFHYAARTWEAIRKSQLVSEYNRLLCG